MITDQTIVVVSGLPRSGTSLMMQLLQAGGLKLFTDNFRERDENNPFGYLEHELVKSLPKDASWVGQAAGMAMKVVVQLVPFLPDRFSYRILLMERDITEILDSQAKMLSRLGRPPPKVDSLVLANTFLRHFESCKKTMAERANIDFLAVPHRELIRSPDEWVKPITEFLTMFELNDQRMRSVVNPELYRSKA